ncbi:MAG: histidinol dehydrogenase, partial [Alphaproteobacteria bacterium]
LKFSAQEIAQAERKLAPELRAALERAAHRIRRYHEKQRPEDQRYTDESGVTLGWQYKPLTSVGLYVPGGKASYPSSVLMNAVPAKVAGVDRIVMVVPTPKGEVNPAVLVAASIAGVNEIYRVGGAQAIGALAFGTATIAAVDKIVGPGNAYVAEAKRQVFGQVGIDTIAGPSEILVVADAKNEPGWIAADLLSQAEHDEAAQAILITNDARFAAAVEREIDLLLPLLHKKEIAAASWQKHGIILTVNHWSEALSLIERIAPEHLELAIDEPEKLAAKVRAAGAIFLGRHTPEAIGDYIAGPSHVLPTSRAARFSSGLSIFDFLTRTSIIGCTPEAARELAPAAALLADAEGLPAHALSLRLRTK